MGYPGHPPLGTVNGNLMHQSIQPNAGIMLDKEQYDWFLKVYNQGLTNRGRQK